FTLMDRPRRKFNFLVNPSDIQTTYGISDALNFMDPSAFNGNISELAEGLNSISFSIMLDRTYEVHYGDDTYAGGVLHDVRALELVAGVPGDVDFSRSQSDIDPDASGSPAFERMEANRSADIQEVSVGLLTKKNLRVIFGAGNSYSFDGFINSLSVHYTHFSSQMVPTRAGVSISMTSRGTLDGADNPLFAGNSSPVSAVTGRSNSWGPEGWGG
ncbi:MAG: hypothetical protein LC679_05120, partial [Intrasporangiaceae bacterium]|nr:hypothetical protein [Intrasporangiaceae bacterium]